MDPSNALQERQLVLMETMNRRLESIQEGQKKLEEANATLRNENEMLRNQLECQQRQYAKADAVKEECRNSKGFKSKCNFYFVN